MDDRRGDNPADVLGVLVLKGRKAACQSDSRRPRGAAAGAHLERLERDADAGAFGVEGRAARVARVDGRVDLVSLTVSRRGGGGGDPTRPPAGRPVLARGLPTWIPSSSLLPCVYWVTSIRETTPDVTLMVSPPMGYPTTVTSSCRRGRSPNSIASDPSQKASSSTVRSAMSHSVPMARTLATNFVSEPRRFTFTCVWCATEWAFVRIFRPAMVNPLLKELYWRFLPRLGGRIGGLSVIAVSQAVPPGPRHSAVGTHRCHGSE